MKNWLHLYGQRECHDWVWIVGDGEGLRRLRQAIDDALNIPVGGWTTTFCGDGEGYRIQVRWKREAEMETLILPYSDPIARAGGGKHPAELEAR